VVAARHLLAIYPTERGIDIICWILVILVQYVTIPTIEMIMPTV